MYSSNKHLAIVVPFCVCFVLFVSVSVCFVCVCVMTHNENVSRPNQFVTFHSGPLLVHCTPYI